MIITDKVALLGEMLKSAISPVLGAKGKCYTHDPEQEDDRGPEKGLMQQGTRSKAKGRAWP